MNPRALSLLSAGLLQKKKRTMRGLFLLELLSWAFHFLIVHEFQVFSLVWGWECCLLFCLSFAFLSWRALLLGSLLEVVHHCLCLFRVCVNNALVKATGGVVSIISVVSPFSHKRGEGSTLHLFLSLFLQIFHGMLKSPWPSCK